MAFSLEEKVIMAQYKIKGKGTSLRVYDVESGELVDFKFEEKFPIDKVDVVFSSFDKDVLNFEVKEKEATGKDGSEMLGKWQLDLKEFEVKKLILLNYDKIYERWAEIFIIRKISSLITF